MYVGAIIFLDVMILCVLRTIYIIAINIRGTRMGNQGWKI